MTSANSNSDGMGLLSLTENPATQQKNLITSMNTSGDDAAQSQPPTETPQSNSETLPLTEDPETKQGNLTTSANTGGAAAEPLALTEDPETQEGNRVTGANTSNTSRFDPQFTSNVIAAPGKGANPRAKKVISSLIQHLHDFCRENEVTVSEWMAAVDFVNAAGRMSDDKRNETQLVCDVLGIESLVDEITYTLAGDAKDIPTATAILGPFWRKDAPKRKMGDSIVDNKIPDGDHSLLYGTVTDHATGEPLENAEVDVWHTAPNGLYEQQDPEQPDMNLRGRFFTGKDGKFSFYCLRPTSYPIPYDGPAGQLLKLLDRHPMRPAHIHFIVSAEGYKPLVTQIFDRRDEHIDNDSVFAVKDSLIVDFQPRKDDPKAAFELKYDFRLASYGTVKQSS